MIRSTHHKLSAVSALAVVASTWTMTLCQSPAAAFATPKGDQATVAERSIQINTMREPVVVSVTLPQPEQLITGDLSAIRGLIARTADRIRSAASSNPNRLITLQPRTSDLAFWTLPDITQKQLLEQYGDEAPAKYEAAAAEFFASILEQADPGRSIALTIVGLPMEGRARSEYSIADTNERYGAVLDRLDAFTSNRSFLMHNSATNEPSYVYLNLSEAMRLHEGRSIIFRTNNIWRIATFVSVSPQKIVSAGENPLLPLADESGAKGGDSNWYEFDEVEPTDDIVVDSGKSKSEIGGAVTMHSGGVKRDTTTRRSGSGGSSSNGSGSGGSGGGGGGGLGGSGGGSGGSGGSGGGSGGGGGGGSGGGLSAEGGSGGSSSGSTGGPGGTWIPDGEADAGGVIPFFGDPLPVDFRPDVDGGGDDGDTPFPVLVPGTGFSGSTGQPGPVGSPWMAGYNAKAIARWDVVPYQTFNDDFHIGVVAFHRNGIQRVAFSAEGGPWTDVTQKKLNPRTGVWEYTATVRAATLADGPVEIRAIVYPKDAGVPRVLAGDLESNDNSGEHSMFLFANAGGSLFNGAVYVSPNGVDAASTPGTASQPFKTIQYAARHGLGGGQTNPEVGGGTIYLLPGDHVFGTYSWANRIQAKDRWLTVRNAPGVLRDQVRITKSGTNEGLRVEKVRVKGVTLASQESGAVLRMVSSPASLVWVDDCHFVGLGYDVDQSPASGFTGRYYTNLLIEDSRNGPTNGRIVRNCVSLRNGEDVFYNARFVINCAAHDVNPRSTGFHSDIYQIHGGGSWENVIVYGLRATDVHDQGFHVKDLNSISNSAFVNVLIARPSNPNNPSARSQWHAPVSDHVLFWHFTQHNIEWGWRGDLFSGTPEYTDVSVKGGAWHSMYSQEAPLDQVDFAHNHFVNGVTFGPNPTTGPAAYTNPANHDFTPKSSSPLLDRVAPLLLPIDALGEQRAAPAAVGALEAQ